jgi:hypothetical protein
MTAREAKMSIREGKKSSGILGWPFGKQDGRAGRQKSRRDGENGGRERKKRVGELSTRVL